MAICRMCHKTIPEGMEFCEECESKRTNQADESYLDSLLSSVSADLDNSTLSVYDNVAKRVANFPTPVNTSSSERSTIDSESDKSSEQSESEPVNEAAVSSLIQEPSPEENTLVPTEEEAPSITKEADEVSRLSEKTEAADSPVNSQDEFIIDAATLEAAAEDFLNSIEEDEQTATEDSPVFETGIDEVQPIQDQIAETVSEGIDVESLDSPDNISEVSVSDQEPYIEADIEQGPENSAFEESSNADGTSYDEEKLNTETSSETEVTADIEIPDITSDIEIEASGNDSEAADIVEESEIAVNESETESELEDIKLDDTSEQSDTAPAESGEDIDELLDSLLADLDEAGIGDNKGNDEPQINVDDLSDIFAAAEDAQTGTSDDISELLQNGSDDIGNIEASSDSDLSEVIEDSELLTDITDADTSESGLPEIEEIDFSSSTIDSQKLEMPGQEPSSDISDNSAGDIGIDSVLTAIDPGTQKEFLTEEDLENNANGTENISDIDLSQVIEEIDSGEFDEKIKTLQVNPSANTEKPAKKPSLFKRLFGNIHLTPEEKAKEEEKAKSEEEKKKQALEAKARKKEESKEQKAQRKEQEKAEKEEKAKLKAEEKRQKQEEAKERTRKKKEEKLALQEFDVDEGRINRVGATILFVIFAIITVFIIVGTNIYSYNLSIKNAEEEFEIRHYNDAYYEVYGLKIQDDDIELYDRIMTVMYVNAQLNSYQYYMTSNNREKALDSLLKGLQRYDKYLELATILDIKDDLNYVKSNILEQLNHEFELSEEEAYDMIEIRDDVDYSEYIYSLLGTYEVNGIE